MTLLREYFPYIALGIAAVLAVVIFRRVVVAPHWPKPVQWLLGALMVVLTGLMFASFRSLWAPLLTPHTARPLAWLGMTWMAFALYLVMGLVPVWVVAVGAWLGGRRRSRAVRTRINRVGVALAAAVALVVTGWGVLRAQDPQVVEWTIASDEVPAQFSGAKVAVITDIHAGSVRSATFTREIVDRTNASHPDLVVIVGDLVDGSADRYAPEIEPLRDLKAPLGVFATTGNHEFISGEVAAWVKAYEALGIRVLQNQAVLLERGGQSIRLVGVHDADAASFTDGAYVTDPEGALKGSKPGEFILLLAHQPKQAVQAQGWGVDLQLSGHTHGGQLWPFRYAVQLQQPMVDGYRLIGDVPVLTSRGAGAWGPPVRVGADPQILLVTLKRG